MKDEDPNTFMFGDKEVTIFRAKEPYKIPWNKNGVEYIVATYADESGDDYYEV
ncbi:hypothetical protein BAE44_0013096 [Dichanthelium oligosanthes]|uniref:Uncharacterized protein n=1 Tax=Dichanthelium oligosanthes TaxID=888268 RepID=A0A1E5VL95_9POAL|nr:hypothetical protein BAE44_0013096 [Dichanthelium oligosanthes]